MFTSPYQTTPCRSYVLNKIEHAVQEEMIEKRLGPTLTSDKSIVDGVVQVLPYSKAVSPFTQPLPFEYDGQKLVVIDVRPFVSSSEQATGGFRTTAEMEKGFLEIYARLTQRWVDGDAAGQALLGDLPARVFTRMVSESIVRRLGVGPIEQMQISIVTAYYYACLFRSEKTMDDRSKDSVAARVARVVSVAPEKVFPYLDDLDVISNIEEFVAALKKVCQSQRMENLSAAAIYSAIGGQWFGANAREHIAVALEYPPAWNALIYAALTYRGYHSAPLSKMVQFSDRNNAGKDFVASLANYLG